MADKDKISNEEKRRRVAEELWLNYFNQTLFETGLITEQIIFFIIKNVNLVIFS